MKLPTVFFDYELPDALIAQHPPEQRGASRMLVLDRITGEYEIRLFADLVDYLNAGDGIVFNNTKVMNARMYGIKNGTSGGAAIEILLLDPPSSGKQNRRRAMLRPGKRVRPGTRVRLTPLERTAAENWFTVIDRADDETFMIEFDSRDDDYLLDTYGHVPLPPYIKRGDANEDRFRYQTIFAREPGAVAAPTAGLHFTPETIAALERKKVITSELTLHVGAGTFKPVSLEDAAEHRMHIEQFALPESTAATVNRIHAGGGRILAAGTTAVRVLESCADVNGNVTARRGSTDIFLYPPYTPRAVDMLLTNFHLPRSTLLMLVCTFAAREKVLAAYQGAIAAGLHFYSYGDCMLLK